MLRKIIGTVCVSMAVLFSTSCIMVNNNGNGIDYGNYSGDSMSIKVENKSNKNVVCFKGTPSEATLISGATATGTTGLKKVTSIFGTDSFDFVLFCVTEEDYLKYSDYDELEKHPFARLYAYYNADAESRTNLVFEISARLGGEFYFELHNSTPYNCEIRQDGLYGTPLMFAGAQTNNTKIYASEGKYNLYPVFRKFDKNSGTIITNYPKTLLGNPQYEEIMLQKGGDEVARIDVADYLTTDFTISPSAAYLKIVNNNSSAVQLFKGKNAVATMTDDGCYGINSGKSGIYTITMDKTSVDSFETQVTYSSWKVGNDRKQVEIPENTYEAGYRYVLNCKGATYDTLSCDFERDKDSNPVKYWIDFEKIENTLTK